MQKVLIVAVLASVFGIVAPTVVVDPDGVGIDVQDCVVRFADEVEVPALATGRVAEVFATDNQSVASGARLVRLDDRSLLNQRRSNQSRLELAKLETSDEIELNYAEIALAEAQAELDASRSVHKDFSGAVPLTQLRRLQLGVERGKLEVARAKKRQSEAKIAVDLAESELSVVDNQLRNLHVESPLSGIVLEVYKNVGEWIETGETLATVARIDQLHVHALLDNATIAPDQCTGLPVSVHWDDPATGEHLSLDGRVISVDPQLMPGGRYRMHAEIVNEQMSIAGSTSTAKAWKLRPGAEVRMKIHAPASIANRSRVPNKY